MQFEEREALLDRAAKAGVAAEDVDLMRAVFDSYAYVTELIEQKNQTLSRLRTIIFGSRTESRANVLGPDNAPESTAPGTEPTPPADIPPESAAPAAAPGKERAKSRGHGRRPVEDYTAAARVPLQVAGLLPGDACPHCQTGTLYELNRPGRLIRFVGNAPVQATVYELQKLRCQGCGQLKTAEPPAEVADAPKYDPTVASSIGVFKYGAGVPFYRAERLQEYAGVPLAASTQWMLVAEAAGAYRPVYGELIRAAAQGDLLHNDDTTARILESMGQRREKALRDLDPAADESPAAPRGDPQRTGMFTTNILAESGSHRIALYFTGGRHAGENLNEVLRQRAAELPPPVQMCDALSRNYPAEFQTIVANCLVHARRSSSRSRTRSWRSARGCSMRWPSYTRPMRMSAKTTSRLTSGCIIIRP